MHSFKLVAAIIAVVTFAACTRADIAIIVQNVGTESLRSVMVHVTGSSYQVGDLAPGEIKVIKVIPKGESHIEIGLGNGKRLNAGRILRARIQR